MSGIGGLGSCVPMVRWPLPGNVSRIGLGAIMALARFISASDREYYSRGGKYKAKTSKGIQKLTLSTILSYTKFFVFSFCLETGH